MTGLTAEFVNTVTHLVIPSLQSLVKYEYGERWGAEWATISGWLNDWGVTVIFAVTGPNEGHMSFIPGADLDLHLIDPDEIVLIYPARR